MQRTLKKAIGASGIGLHTVEPVNPTLRPAPPGTGIVRGIQAEFLHCF